MMTDCRGVIEYVNPAFAVLTGYTRDEACGKSPCISPIRRAGSGGLPGTLWKTILAGNVFRGILVNRKKNGELYYVEVSICPSAPCAMVKAIARISLPRGGTLPSVWGSKPSLCKHKNGCDRAPGRAAVHMTSMHCRLSSPATRNSRSTRCRAIRRTRPKFRRFCRQPGAPPN
jgi:hypothetical protein